MTLESPTSPPTPAIELRGVGKRYHSTIAVNAFDLAVHHGEVHALMGENGAGKSTVMKVISGNFDDYSGQILIDGTPVDLHTPAAARAHGIAMVYQELSLAAPLSIAENLFANHLPARYGWIDRRTLRDRSLAALKRVGLEDLDPSIAVSELSQHECQMVEIAKALANHPRILVLDEPTSSLSREEVDRLLTIVRKLRQEGLAIIFISHHLPEVMRIGDRVTVMRDGCKVKTLPMTQVSPDSLVEMMVGRGLAAAELSHGTGAEEILAVDRLTRYGFFHDVSFNLRRGEVLGIGGLAGSGRSEVARSLCGIDPVDEGDITLLGEDYTPTDFRHAMRCGLGYLSEDRKLEGLALDVEAFINSNSALQAKRGRRSRRVAALALFSRLGKSLALYPLEPQRNAMEFSGGNQQKILLTKWLAIDAQVLILDEPTRGVDVGAKKIIHEAISAFAASGRAVILISSDLPELVSLSTRVMILRGGRPIAELPRSSLTEDAILLAAYGERRGAVE